MFFSKMPSLGKSDCEGTEIRRRQPCRKAGNLGRSKAPSPRRQNTRHFQNLLLTLVSVSVASAIALFSPSVSAQNTPIKNSGLQINSKRVEANSTTGIVTFIGNVRMNYPARQIQGTAAQAQYYSRERRLVLSGNVYVLQEGNSMQAETMTYLIDEGHFTATPKANQQVESIYLIPENPNNSNSSSTPQIPQFEPTSPKK
jgi:lipopolysaccharide export system protein LptA